MAPNYGFFMPEFYAQEGLIALENSLGMSARLYRGFDEERRAFRKGETINIKRPGTFTVQDAPATAEEIDVEGLSMTLGLWKEVKFKLTDKDLALTEDEVVQQHIQPAVYKLADYIDAASAELALECPHIVDVGSPADVDDVIALRTNMFNRKVPIRDGGSVMVGGTTEGELLALSAFAQNQGSGAGGIETQRTANLGERYGMRFFANQNVLTKGAGGSITASAAKVQGATAKGATSVIVDDTTLTGTVKRGDVLVVTSTGQRIAITADATASGNAITLTVNPLRTALADNAGVTFVHPATGVENLGFHPNFAAIAFAKLPDVLGRELGIKVASVQAPRSNIALRSRIYAMPNVSEVHVAFDVLLGMKVLDGDLACRWRD